MLIAALTALFVLVFAGGSGGDRNIQATAARLESAVQACVEDSGRAEQGSRIAQEIQSEVKAFLDQVKQDREALLEVDARREATDEALWKVFNEMTAHWEKHERRILDLRFELKAKLTREEWKALFQALEDTVAD